MNMEDWVNDNLGLIVLGTLVAFAIGILFGAWMVMLGYPLVVNIVLAEGQELVNQTISYVNSLVLILGTFLMSGGPLTLLKMKG